MTPSKRQLFLALACALCQLRVLASIASQAKNLIINSPEPKVGLYESMQNLRGEFTSASSLGCVVPVGLDSVELAHFTLFCLVPQVVQVSTHPPYDRVDLLLVSTSDRSPLDFKLVAKSGSYNLYRKLHP